MQPSAFCLDIQRFIRGFKSTVMANNMLCQKFAINVTADGLVFGDGSSEIVFLYNYDMLKAKGGLKIENEARGLILNGAGEIVSMSFPRFFNHNEGHAAELDWEHTNAEIKLDGTLITVYAYKGNYYIQTRGRANADGPVGQSSDTFHQRVFELFSHKFNDPFGPFKANNPNEKYCWVFEYVSPDNRIVTPYDYEGLFLMAAYNKLLCSEVKPEYVDQFAAEYHFQRPPFARVTSMKDVDKLIDKMDPLEEGLVLVDHRFRRVKVKNPGYLSIARVKNAGIDLQPRHFADIVLKGDGKEIAGYYPEYKEILLFLEEVVTSLMKEVDTMWKLYKIAPDRKTFAENVKSHPLCHLLFLAWDGQIKDMSDALKHIKPEFLVNVARHYQAAELEDAFQSAIEGRTKEEKVKHASS
jgi:hypothetical protein